MPQVYDPTNGKGRRRRKRKVAEDTTTSHETIEVRSASRSGGVPRPQTFLPLQSHPPRRPGPTEEVLRKKPTHQSSIIAEHDPFDFGESNARTSEVNKDRTPSMSLAYPHPENKDNATTLRSPNKVTNVTDLLDERRAATGEMIRHVVALDTRCLNTKDGRDEYKKFHQGAVDYLHSSTLYGMAPFAVLWVGNSGCRSSGDVTLSDLGESEYKVVYKKWAKDLVLPTELPIHVSSTFEGNQDKKEGISLPQELTAKRTWDLFAAFVEEAVDERQCDKKDSVDRNTPLSLTILTRDTLSLLDTSEESHFDGVDNFLAATESQFRKCRLQTVRIVIMTGRTVVSDASSIRGNNGESKVSPCHESESSTIGILEETRKLDDLFRQWTLQITFLLQRIQNRIETKSEEVFRINKSRIQFDSSLISRLDVRLLNMNWTTGFQRLQQIFMHDALAVCKHSWCRDVQLELPETSDFDPCVLSLRASYNIMPFRLDSALAAGLCSDLERLSRSKVEVIQLTSLESIDSGLLYGVAISIQPGLGETTEQHVANSMLVRSVFNTLATKDCALLLRAHCPLDGCDQSIGEGLFHTTADCFFLLIPEKLGTKNGLASSCGLLYRIANSPLMIEQNTSSGSQSSIHRFYFQDAVMNEYAEYVHASLESLKCSPLNPLLLKARETDPKKGTKFLEQKKVIRRGDATDTSPTQQILMNGTAEVKLLDTFDDVSGRNPTPDNDSQSRSLNDDFGIGSIMKKKLENGIFRKESTQRVISETETTEKSADIISTEWSAATKSNINERKKKNEVTGREGAIQTYPPPQLLTYGSTSSTKVKLLEAFVVIHERKTTPDDVAENQVLNDDSGIGSIMKKELRNKMFREELMRREINETEVTEKSTERIVEGRSITTKSPINERRENYEPGMDDRNVSTNVKTAEFDSIPDIDESAGEEDVDDIEESDDDELTAPIDSTKRTRRKPTEPLVFVNGQKDRLIDESEAEWEASEGEDASSLTDSSSLATNSSQEASPMGKFDYA